MFNNKLHVWSKEILNIIPGNELLAGPSVQQDFGYFGIHFTRKTTFGVCPPNKAQTTLTPIHVCCIC